MKLKYLIFPALLVAMLLGSTTVRAQETVTNEEVISLTKAGLASSIIIGKIRSSKTNFDTSADALIKLKQNAVGDDVIAAMFDAKNPSSPTGAPSNSTGAAVVAPAGDPNDPMYGYEPADRTGMS